MSEVADLSCRQSGTGLQESVLFGHVVHNPPMPKACRRRVSEPKAANATWSRGGLRVRRHTASIWKFDATCALSESSNVAETARIRTRLCSNRLQRADTSRATCQAPTRESFVEAFCPDAIIVLFLAPCNASSLHRGPAVGQSSAQSFHELIKAAEESHYPILVAQSLESVQGTAGCCRALELSHRHPCACSSLL